jgi:hypothetical protein
MVNLGLNRLSHKMLRPVTLHMVGQFCRMRYALVTTSVSSQLLLMLNVAKTVKVMLS